MAINGTTKERLADLTLRLRRYARALTQASPAASDGADELVRATLLHIQDMGLNERRCDIRLLAFAVLVHLARDRWQERQQQVVGARHAAMAHTGRNRGTPDGATDRGAKFADNKLTDDKRNDSKGTDNWRADNRLLCGLADLAWEEREALLLVVLEQFSYAQAMQILHVSHAGLMARLARARAQLAAALAPPQMPAAPARRGSHLRLVK